ncbi:hypothetical protein I79_006208 [Cricetulus griseus]|uniref:Uncharacterized protein n=1 Tax=Cricetulus griseus TaxID=10029 RepID=G3H781_CRIGR|nr:hypothetical protein I79_006208 [Cricetulus griseus]
MQTNKTTCGFYFRAIIKFCKHLRHQVAQEAVYGHTMEDPIVTPPTGILDTPTSRCLPAECPVKTEMKLLPFTDAVDAKQLFLL